MTVQTAVLIETLVELGADVRWVSCNIFSTQDHAAAATVVGPGRHRRRAQGVPVYRLEGRDPAGVLVVHAAGAALARWQRAEPDPRRRRRRHPAGAPRARVRGRRAPSRRSIRPTARSSAACCSCCTTCAPPRATSSGTTWRRPSAASPKRPPPACTACTSASSDGTLLFPAINVNDSVTKSKFDNIYGCRHSLVDAHHARDRRPDRRQEGPGLRLRRRRQGLGAVAAGPVGARRRVTEIDPICALQACMLGLDVVRLDDVVGDFDIFVTTTGNRSIISVEHMKRMKHNAIVCNIGHFDNEIDMAEPREAGRQRARSRRSRSSRRCTSSSSRTRRTAPRAADTPFSSWPRADWSTSVAPPVTRASS